MAISILLLQYSTIFCGPSKYYEFSLPPKCNKSRQYGCFLTLNPHTSHIPPPIVSIRCRSYESHLFSHPLVKTYYKSCFSLHFACLLQQTHNIYTGCNRRNGPDFGRVFLRSNYTDITQNTYIQSSMVTEILAREV